jgi:hypothetical protein
VDPLHVMHQIEHSDGSIGRAAEDAIFMVQKQRDGARISGDLVEGLAGVHVAHEHSSITAREESLSDYRNRVNLETHRDRQRQRCERDRGSVCGGRLTEERTLT